MMLVIFGPTATGKTGLALKLAQKLNGELISADSRQIYKGLNIGSGKIGLEDSFVKGDGFWLVNGIRIDGFDIRNPGDSFSAADFLHFAHSSLVRIGKAGKTPIVVGGTGFYIKSLLEGIDTLGIKQNLKLRKELEKLTTKDLFEKLLSLNPLRARAMNLSDKNNPRRLIRAIEVAITNIVSVPNHGFTPGVNKGIRPESTPGVSRSFKERTVLIGLTAPNDFIFKKADLWLEERLEKGLIEEVDNLIKSGVEIRWLDSLGLEYRWIKRHLSGDMTLSEAVKRLEGDIHDLIRRQKTFFTQFKNIKLYDVSKENWDRRVEADIKKLLGRG